MAQDSSRNYEVRFTADGEEHVCGHEHRSKRAAAACCRLIKARLRRTRPDISQRSIKVRQVAIYEEAR